MQLFKIEETVKEGNTFTFKVLLDGKHRIFEGHFPENPVVPGVCTIDMVKGCCSSILGRDVRFDYIKEVKFLAAIIPSQHKELRVVITLKSDDTEVVAVVYAEEVTMMKLKATII